MQEVKAGYRFYVDSKFQDSRGVKGGALKMHCICFVGSNPTPGIGELDFMRKIINFIIL